MGSLMLPTFAPTGVMDCVIVLLVFPIIIFLSTGIGDNIALTTLGHASFALYAIETPVVNWILLLAAKAGRPLEDVGLAGGLGLMIVCFVIALAADRYFDRPIRKWLNERRSPRTR